MVRYRMATPDATVLHVGAGDGVDDRGDGVDDRIHSALAEAPDVDVRSTCTVDEAVLLLRETDVDCLVAACDPPDGSAADLVATAREIAPDVGCVVYGRDPSAIAAGDAETGLVEFVPAGADEAVERVVQLVATTGRERTQTTYPLPPQERERLASLDRYDLDDEDALPALQDVVDHAADHFDVPQASINVIGSEVQRFAVCHDEDWAPIPRQDSICTYAVVDDGPTVVDDVASDPRFAENDAVAELGVRSYASAPIEPDDDRPIATLCVYDEQPGRFDAAAASYLQTLARDAAAVIARTADDIDEENHEEANDR